MCGVAAEFSSESDVDAHLDACAPVSSYLASSPSDSAIAVVVRLLANVVREPGNEKFRRIRLGNAKIKEAISDVGGGIGLIESAGFRVTEEGGETWAVINGTLDDARLNVVREMVGLLESKRRIESGVVAGKEDSAVVSESSVSQKDGSDEAEKANTIDREVQVFFRIAESAVVESDLPDSFYARSSEEVMREAKLRKERLEQSRLLIPKSYKEKQAAAARQKYKKTVLRIEFPDGIFLQATFLPWEPTSTLYEFVSASLKEPSLEFELLRPASPKLRAVPCFPAGGGKAPTLLEEELVPSAVLKFKPKETADVFFTGLIDELLEISRPLPPTDAA